jgi:hypothetical protein
VSYKEAKEILEKVAKNFPQIVGTHQHPDMKKLIIRLAQYRMLLS